MRSRKTAGKAVRQLFNPTVQLTVQALVAAPQRQHGPSASLGLVGYVPAPARVIVSWAALQTLMASTRPK